jgi:hypothetical protein
MECAENIVRFRGRLGHGSRVALNWATATWRSIFPEQEEHGLKLRAIAVQSNPGGYELHGIMRATPGPSLIAGLYGAFSVRTGLATTRRPVGSSN